MRGHDCPTLIPKTLGRFRILNEHISGPADYMEARGNALVDRICAARDTVFMAAMPYAPQNKDGQLDLEMLMLHRVQADFLAWKGESASTQS